MTIAATTTPAPADDRPAQPRLRIDIIERPDTIATGGPGSGPGLGAAPEPEPGRPALELEPGGGATIGRNRACDLVLDDERVARTHAALLSKGGGWYLADCDASFATMLNGVRMGSEVAAPLEHGDTITIGLWTFRVCLGAEPCPASEAAGSPAAVVNAAASHARRLTLLEEQLAAAREAQQLIIPPSNGVVGGLRYALVMRPGLVVAGDLFDVLPIGEGKVAVFLGDVTGEGVGAGIMMASAQAFLHAELSQHGDPELAVNRANGYLAAHSPVSRFVSLWVGLFDRDAGTLRYVDAGHGHWLVVPADGRPRSIQNGGGIPMAIEGSFEYLAEEIDFGPSDRLVLFSDGVIEQKGGPMGGLFGLEQAVETLTGTWDCDRDTQMLVASVMFHAGREQLDDDTTIAGVQWA